MDQVVRQHSYWVDWPMQRKPSEYVGRNVFVTGLDDVEGFRQARQGSELVGRAAMFSIDYPHEISLFGRTQQILTDLTHGLDPKVKRDILAGTAMKLYNLTETPDESEQVREAVVAVS
jgi:predicted TIM-barrel fold metal-dependent hydrolase